MHSPNSWLSIMPMSQLLKSVPKACTGCLTWSFFTDMSLWFWNKHLSISFPFVLVYEDFGLHHNHNSIEKDLLQITGSITSIQRASHFLPQEFCWHWLVSLLICKILKIYQEENMHFIDICRCYILLDDKQNLASDKPHCNGCDCDA